MKRVKKIKKRWSINIEKVQLLLLALIVALGILLRSHNLSTWPREGATFDEYAWPWLGISLIQKQVPTSWSPHQLYKDRKEIRYRGAAFILATPYLEHPPFFGLVAGSYALLNGADSMFDIDLARIRGLALLLGIISIVGVYLLANELYGKTVGLVSALLYATIPTIVVGSRLLQNENFFIPCFLFALYFTTKYLTTRNKVYRTVVGVICGLLTLAKIPWFAAAVAVVLIFLYTKRYKDIIPFLAIVFLIFSLFFMYGFYFDSTLFLNLWRFQLNRYDLTFNSIFALFTSPYLADRMLLDGWIYFGWIAYFLLLLGNIRKNYILIFGLLAYFAIFVFAIPNEPGHGWYRYPFYPFLAISTGFFIKEYFNKNYLLTFFFLIFVGLSLFELTWGNYFGFSFIVFRIILFFFGASLIPLFLPWKGLKNITTWSNYAFLAIFFLLNIWVVLQYNEQ